MNPFHVKGCVTVSLREQTVTADVDARYDGSRIDVRVQLQDAEGRPLEWTLGREELSVIIHAAKDQAAGAENPPG